MICDRCGNKNVEWISGKTYKGLDIHHNPPEFISNFLKEKWSGEFYNLCRECHVNLHKEIKQILFKNSNLIKFVNSEYWLMNGMNLLQIKKANFL